MAKFKPGASVKTHLLVAALLWSLVGGFLFFRGGRWVSGSGWEIFLLVSMLLGLCKSRMILDRVANRNIERIVQSGDGSCLGGVYSFKTWGLVIVMIVLGRFLRSSSVPIVFVGLLYVTVGCSLFWSSRMMWKKWWGIHNSGS
ncbi:MAG: hypothetical protein KKB30_02160 [Proteobacteria bacterium]|nr:hypothetical protein [Pseudomonadota bacterium]MBU1717259.1 hypothetical protein [Pseudomonadota bacterium]